MENTETTIVENNAEVISQPIKKKSNKKVVILTTVIAIVVLGIVATVIAIVAGNSNSLWLPPLDGADNYGYKMTPDEFVAKVNECDFGVDNYVFNDTTSGQGFDMYGYTGKYGSKTFPALMLNYYPDNTIRTAAIGVHFDNSSPYGMQSFKNVCTNLSEPVVQILYAYNAFEKNASEKDMIDVADMIEESGAFENVHEYLQNYFVYEDFMIIIQNLNRGEVSGTVMLSVEKIDEEYVEKREQMGINVIDLASEN